MLKQKKKDEFLEILLVQQFIVWFSKHQAVIHIDDDQ